MHTNVFSYFFWISIFFPFLNSSGEDFNIYVLKLCRSPKKHSIFNPLLSVSLKTLCFTLFVILSNRGEVSVKSVPIVTSQKAYWHTLAGSGFRRMDYKFPYRLEKTMPLNTVVKSVLHLVWWCCCPQELITFFAWISINFLVFFLNARLQSLSVSAAVGAFFFFCFCLSGLLATLYL